MIRVYCVGIHFRHHIDFVPTYKNIPDPSDPTKKLDYMQGSAILADCANKWGLRYKLTSKPPSAVEGHINYVSYTPNAKTDNEATDPGSAPRVTFAVFGAKEFPFFGQPLSLTEILRPIGEQSQVLQYTVQSLDLTKPAPKVYFPNPPSPLPHVDTIKPANDGTSSFGAIGIPDNTEVRIRSLNIFCTY